MVCLLACILAITKARVSESDEEEDTYARNWGTRESVNPNWLKVEKFGRKRRKMLPSKKKKKKKESAVKRIYETEKENMPSQSTRSLHVISAFHTSCSHFQCFFSRVNRGSFFF